MREHLCRGRRRRRRRAHGGRIELCRVAMHAARGGLGSCIRVVVVSIFRTALLRPRLPRSLSKRVLSGSLLRAPLTSASLSHCTVSHSKSYRRLRPASHAPQAPRRRPGCAPWCAAAVVKTQAHRHRRVQPAAACGAQHAGGRSCSCAAASERQAHRGGALLSEAALGTYI